MVGIDPPSTADHCRRLHYRTIRRSMKDAVETGPRCFHHPRRAQAAGSINLPLSYRTLRAEQAGTGGGNATMGSAANTFSSVPNDWLVESLQWGKSTHTAEPTRGIA
jgi:hypothetical protein